MCKEPLNLFLRLIVSVCCFVSRPHVLESTKLLVPQCGIPLSQLQQIYPGDCQLLFLYGVFHIRGGSRPSCRHEHNSPTNKSRLANCNPDSQLYSLSPRHTAGIWLAIPVKDHFWVTHWAMNMILSLQNLLNIQDSQDRKLNHGATLYQALHSASTAFCPRTLQPMKRVPNLKRPVGRPRKRPREDPEAQVQPSDTPQGSSSKSSKKVHNCKEAASCEVCQGA